MFSTMRVIRRRLVYAVLFFDAVELLGKTQTRVLSSTVCVVRSYSINEFNL